MQRKRSAPLNLHDAETDLSMADKEKLIYLTAKYVEPFSNR